MAEKLLVTGASGQLGRLVLDELLASGSVEDSDIIAVTRYPSNLAEYADKGVEVRPGSFDEALVLEAAFTDANRVLIISTDSIGEPGKRLEQHKNAVAAAKNAGASHILYTSMPNPGPESKVLFAPDHRGTEQAIKDSGLSYTILRNGWYMENLMGSLPQTLASGKWYTSAGDGKNSYTARADIAKAIAHALASDSTDNKIYTLTGPQALTTDEIAEIVTEATGTHIEVVHVSDDQLAEGLKTAGLPEPVVPLLVSFDANTRDGNFDVVTNDIETLTGNAPRSLQEFLAENKAALGG